MLAYDIILELNAPVAQLDRVTGYEPVGRGFESLLAHQRIYALCELAGCVFCCQLYNVGGVPVQNTFYLV